MSLPGMLIIAIMVGFFILAAIRLVPPYVEYLSVKRIVEEVAREHDPNRQSLGQVRRKVGQLFYTSQIYGIKAEEIDLYRKKGKTYIDASYEVRVPMVGRIDAVIKFDDLVFIAGTPVAQSDE
jgi:hypothetical protein